MKTALVTLGDEVTFTLPVGLIPAFVDMLRDSHEVGFRKGQPFRFTDPAQMRISIEIVDGAIPPFPDLFVSQTEGV